jgi:hypothetical protein
MNEHPATFVFGLLFLLFGGAYLLDVLEIWDLRPIRLWPVVLIAIGAVVALGGKRGDRER